LRRHRDVVQAIATLWLGPGEGECRLALDDAADHLGCAFAAGAPQKAAADDHGAQVRLDHQRLAELFHDHHHLGRPAAQPAKLFRERGAQDAKILGQGSPDFWSPAGGRSHGGAALVEVVGVSQERREGVAQQGLFFGEGKIHRGLSCWRQ